eukprot:6191201-Pleurochrysis_carterae.AAC.5
MPRIVDAQCAPPQPLRAPVATQATPTRFVRVDRFRQFATARSQRHLLSQLHACTPRRWPAKEHSPHCPTTRAHTLPRPRACVRAHAQLTSCGSRGNHVCARFNGSAPAASTAHLHDTHSSH